LALPLSDFGIESNQYRNHAPPHVSLNSKPQPEFSSGKNFVNPNAFNSAGR